MEPSRSKDSTALHTSAEYFFFLLAFCFAFLSAGSKTTLPLGVSANSKKKRGRERGGKQETASDEYSWKGFYSRSREEKPSCSREVTQLSRLLVPL